MSAPATNAEGYMLTADGKPRVFFGVTVRLVQEMERVNAAEAVYTLADRLRAAGLVIVPGSSIQAQEIRPKQKRRRKP